MPLGVEVGENVPHVELPHLTDQVTPPLALSLLTTAVRLAFAPVFIDVGGCWKEPNQTNPQLTFVRRRIAGIAGRRKAFVHRVINSRAFHPCGTARQWRVVPHECLCSNLHG